MLPIMMPTRTIIFIKNSATATAVICYTGLLRSHIKKIAVKRRVTAKNTQAHQTNGKK